MTMTRLSGDTATPPGRPRSRQIHDVDEDNEWLFSCRCESAKPVSTLLTCLRGTSTLQPVTVFVSPSSITFHVYGTARQSQASVDLQAGLFSHYQVNRRSTANANANTNANSNGNSASASHPTTVTDATPHDSSQLQIPHDEWQHGGEFCVNLSTVLECLFVLGTHALEKTKLSMSYNIHTEIFKLELLEEGGVLSTAAIPGMVPPTHAHQDDDGGDSSLALAFRSTPIVARIILKSDFLRDALQEIDVVSGASTCSILLTPNKGLEFVTVGNQSDCVITIPATCSCISSFECASAGGGAGTSRSNHHHHHHARSYPITSLQSAMRGLEFAEETCISINENGMIAIQHQILDTVGQGSPNFVDYIMTCLLNDDDESSATTSAGRGTQERPTSSQGISQSQSSSEHPYSLGWAVGNQITPGLSSQRNGGMKTTNPHSAIYDDDDEKENDDDDDGDLPPASTVQLFGTLDTESPSATLRNRSNSRRRRRRLVETENDDEENNNANDDNNDGSQALLFGKNNDSEIVLDVTALTSPPRRGRRVNPDEYDGSSSPELVFK